MNKAASGRVPSAEELRKAVLSKAAQRGAKVASRRIAFRWAAWALGRGLLGLTAAAAMLAPLIWIWHAWTAEPGAATAAPQSSAQQANMAGADTAAVAPAAESPPNNRPIESEASR